MPFTPVNDISELKEICRQTRIEIVMDTLGPQIRVGVHQHSFMKKLVA